MNSTESCFCETTDTTGHHDIALSEKWVVLIRSIAEWDKKDFEYNPDESCIFETGFALAKKSLQENPKTQRATREGNCRRCGKYYHMVYYPPEQTT